jgi:hypothetical protein
LVTTRGIRALPYVLIFSVFAAREARAHTLGISSGEYRATDRGVAVRLSFAVPDGVTLVPSLDGDRDRRVSAAEVGRAREDVARAFARTVVVLGDGRPCASALTDVALTEGDGLLVELGYTCEDGPRGFDVTVGFLDALDASHRHVARTVGEATEDTLLAGGQKRLSFHAKPGAEAPKPSSPRAGVWTGAFVGLLLVALGVGWAKRRRALPSSSPERTPKS